MSIDLTQFDKMGPFEIKDELIKLAKKTSKTTQTAFLNAGRGNPNWIATQPREAFFLLGKFALGECRRVRDDKILSSRFWKSSFEERRCLVPATSFCEPNGDVKPATWHWFSLTGSEARPLFAFPGIWRKYQGSMKKDGPKVEVETYAFLTTTPNSLVATINHERMPVLLTKEEEFETWLRGSPDEAFALESIRLRRCALYKRD